MTIRNLPWVGKMPDEMYHGIEMHEYVSSTMLKALAHSPAHLRHLLDNPRDKETDALRLGKALHCAILDGPEVFNSLYRVRTVADWRTAAGKAEKAAMEQAGVTSLTADESAMCLGLLATFESHPEVMDLIESDPDPLFENVILWRDQETGLLCRAKPDIYGLGFMIDLKGTRDARPIAFNRQFFQLGYHIQAAHYAAGWEAVMGRKATDGLQFVFFAMEKTPPFGNILYRVTREVMLYGQQERRDLMLKYADCANKNDWPGYGHEVKELTLPWGVGGGHDDDDNC